MTAAPRVHRQKSIHGSFSSGPGAVLYLLIAALLIARAALATSGPIPINLAFSIASIELPGGVSIDRLNVRCAAIVVEQERIFCPRAELRARLQRSYQLNTVASLEWSPGGRALRLKTSRFPLANGLIEMTYSRSNYSERFESRFERINAPELWAALGPYLPPTVDYEFPSGEITGSVSCSRSDQKGPACELTATVDQLDMIGVNGAEGADLELYLNARRPDDWLLDASLTLAAGAFYIEPGFAIGDIKPGFLIAAENEPVSVKTELAVAENEQVSIRVYSVDLSHPEVVQASFRGDLFFPGIPGESITWETLDLSIDSPAIDRFYSTYVQPVALATTLGSLELSGAIGVALQGYKDEITDLNIALTDAFADDEYNRFAFYDVDGQFILTSSEVAEASSIGWQGASFFGLPLGSGRIDWSSKARSVRIVDWQDVSIFDGGFRVDELEVNNFGRANAVVVVAGTLLPVSLVEVTAAFGWPPLAGKVSADIPRMSFQNKRLELDGDVRIQLFEGEVVVSQLSIDRVFSTVPALSANIDVSGVDLATLTSTVSFGNISGTLDGYIDELRLEAWQPVSFDAFFATRKDDPVRHRISRQAVDNLGRLGAGTGVVSSGWLRFIPNYSYGELGIGCKLEHGYCQMYGVEPARDGNYHILTSGGLVPPWISIKGAGSRIEWRTLVDGVRQISQGEWKLDIGARRGDKRER